MKKHRMSHYGEMDKKNSSHPKSRSHKTGHGKVHSSKFHATLDKRTTKK